MGPKMQGLGLRRYQGVPLRGERPMWRSGNTKDRNPSSHGGSVVMKPTSIHEDGVRSLASLSGLRIQCCHELGCRSKMWLGSGIAVAVL